MLCIINIFPRLRVVCLPSMALSAMACWRCQRTPLTISANHEGRPARCVAKKIPIDFRNVIAKSRSVSRGQYVGFTGMCSLAPLLFTRRTRPEFYVHAIAPDRKSL